MNPGDPRPLDYATPEPKELPTWVPGPALVFWLVLVLAIYGSAVMAPIMLIVGIIGVIHPNPDIIAFGEPIITTWQKVRCILFPAMLTAVFVPLVIWLHKQRKPHP